MKDLIRTNLPNADKFNRMLNIIIDDLLTINNPEFSDYISKIYPNELELKQTTEGHSKFTTDHYDRGKPLILQL